MGNLTSKSVYAHQMKFLFKKLKFGRPKLSLVTFLSAAILLLLAHPWLGLFSAMQDATVIGLPVSYAFLLLGVPLIGILVLIVHNTMAEDIDRHTLEFENE